MRIDHWATAAHSTRRGLTDRGCSSRGFLQSHFTALAASVAIWLTPGAGAMPLTLPGYDVVTYQHPGAPITGFRDINAAGDVVGYYQTDAADFNTARALRIVGGVAETIDPPISTSDRRAFGNNDAGVVVGSFNATGQHGFVLGGAAYTQVDFPGTTQGTTIRGLNNLGDFVGEYDDAVGVQHGFLRRGTTFQSFDAPGAVSTTVRDINDTGFFVGFYADAGGAQHGYIAGAGGFATIDHPDPTAVSTLVGGINNGGVVAGAWLAALGSPESQPARGFLHEPATGVFTPFDLVEATSTIPINLNDAGQVVGEAVLPDGTHVGFIATPIPEPTTAASIASGVVLLVRREGRRR